MSKRKDGSGSIYQRKDGRWVAQIRHYDEFAGKSKPITRYAKTRDEARERLKELLASPTPTSPRTHSTLAAWLAHWRTSILPHSGLAPTTITLYHDTLKWYAEPAAGQIPLATLTPSQAEQWVARIKQSKKRDGKPISSNTARNTYNASVKALDAAVRDRLIDTNPLRDVTRPVAARPAVPHTSPHDMDRLLAHVEGLWIGPLVVFVAYTGCRIGEALSLSWTDTDLSRHTATFRKSGISRETTKNKRIRTVALVPVVVDNLRQQQQWEHDKQQTLGKAWPDTGLVFTSATGTPLQRGNTARALTRELDALGIDTARPWHSLRHGTAHRLIAAGVPLSMVSAMLGHSGIQITNDLYGHVDAALPMEVLTQAFDGDPHP